VSLEGEAGIGKTSAALDFVGAHRSDAQVYAGGCEQLSTPEPLQADNICLAGGAQWRGHFVLRLSLIAAPLVEADVDRLAAAILAAWRRVCSAARQRQLAPS
jgi:hypothetical protein